jgi:hypothetical protein
MTDNIVEFRAAAKPRTHTFIDQADEEDWTPLRQNRIHGPNMHTFAFRSLTAILESDETDLVRDIRFDLDKAKTKLKRISKRLKSVQEQAAAQVQRLTAAEAKLTAAITAAQTAPADDKSDAYRDLLAAFGKLDRHGRKSVLCYLATQV